MCYAISATSSLTFAKAAANPAGMGTTLASNQGIYKLRILNEERLAGSLAPPFASLASLGEGKQKARTVARSRWN